jgi:hypothetical protein
VSKECTSQKVGPVANNTRIAKHKEKGRVYTISGVEASQSEDLIQGSCDMAGNLLTVLFDSGATHSFIFIDRVKQLNLPVRPLPFDLIVSTPTAKPLVADLVCLNCPIVIHNRRYLVDLICLPLKQLDVILGMD